MRETRHITAKQAGETLGISTSGVYKLIERKRLSAARIGHRLWIPAMAVYKMARARHEAEGRWGAIFDLHGGYPGLWAEIHRVAHTREPKETTVLEREMDADATNFPTLEEENADREADFQYDALGPLP